MKGFPSEHYIQRAKDSLFELSAEKKDFQKAVREWKYTGRVYNFDRKTVTCQLCFHEDLKTHFEILNAATNCTLEVSVYYASKFPSTTNTALAMTISKISSSNSSPTYASLLLRATLPRLPDLS